MCAYLLHVESDLGGSQTAICEPQLVQVSDRFLSSVGLQWRELLSWEKERKKELDSTQW